MSFACLSASMKLVLDFKLPKLFWIIVSAKRYLNFSFEDNDIQTSKSVYISYKKIEKRKI